MAKGWLDNYNDSTTSAPEGFVGEGIFNGPKFDNPAWGGQFQMGGNLPGAVGHMYARTGSPSKGPRRNQTDVTDASAQNGKEMQYYQNGLDWKPKSISKNGAWLDNYDVAQEGINLPSVRDLITDTMNRKIQERKGKGKETKVTQKDNVKTVTPKIGKVATAKEKEQRAIEENKQAQEASELQARKDWVQGSMEEAYKSPLMSPGYFTPEGVAIGALQGATKLGPDLYEGNYKGAAMDALMMLPIGIPAAKGLGRALGPEEGLMGKVSQEVNINRNLNKIKKEGQLEGLSDYEIAKKQMEQVGITSNQRKAYTPIVSEFAEKYIRPVGYGGTGFGNKTKLAQTIDNIKRGGFNTEEVMPTRLDAWKLYLGRPQVNETFNLADTAPVIHPSYKPGSLEGMDIYNINSKEILSTVAPDIRPVNFRKNDYMNVLENPISISNDPEIMGGYNRVMTKQGTQYNDIWDLDPAIKLKSLFPNKVSENSLLENVFYKTNTAGVQTPRGIKIPVSKFFGKPFMSHGNVPTTSNQYVEALKETLKDKLLFRENFSPEQIRQYTKDLTNLKNYPKFKKGGIIKDDRGQWDHPGEITEINSNDITMEGVPYDVLGVSDTGDVKMMKPGKNYKFKGKKVTEFPMAQNGKTQQGKTYDFSGGRVNDMKQFIINEVNKDKKTKVDANPSKKDNTFVKTNKLKDETFFSPKESKIKKSVVDQVNFTKNWMDSPMYDEMVDNSTTGYFDEQYLNSGRDFNFNNVKIVANPQPKDLPRVGADSNSKTGLIRLYPAGSESDALEGMIAHEISHSSDKPTDWGANWFEQHGLKPVNKYNNKYTKKEVRLIPEKDINLMKSFYSDSKSYKKLFNKSALKNKDLNKDREWFNYVSEPTETRARLNDIRYNAKKYNIYDPYTQKINSKQLKQIKELTKKAGGFDPYNQLNGIYTDKEIMNMLNTISQNNNQDDDQNIAVAKNGLRQEQKGLQNLDNLTNFTNYNKPQPGGWLNKYKS